MDRSGAPPDVESLPSFSTASVWLLLSGSFAMDLLVERPLFSRTSVCASEKAVPVRVGGSMVTAAAGRCIVTGSAPDGLPSDGDGDEAFACRLRDTGMVESAADELVVPMAGLLPSLMETFRSMGVCLPPRGGESRVTESMDGRPAAAAFICVLDGGRSLGNREKDPPCGGPVDMLTGWWSASSGPDSSSLCCSSLIPRLFSRGEHPGSSGKRRQFRAGLERDKMPLYRYMFQGVIVNPEEEEESVVHSGSHRVHSISDRTSTCSRPPDSNLSEIGGHSLSSERRHMAKGLRFAACHNGGDG